MTKQPLQSAENRQAWLLPALCLFTATFFIYRVFDIRMFYSYLGLVLLFSLHLFDRLRHDEPPRLTPVTLASAVLVLMILLQYLRPDARRHNADLAYCISTLICIAYLLLDPARDRDVRLAEKILYCAAMILAVYVVVFTFLPELFFRLLYPHFSEATRIYHDAFAHQGYGICLGNFTYTDYILFLGVAVCCSCLAAKPRTSCITLISGLSLAFLLLAMVVLGRRGELLAALLAVSLLVLALCTRRRRRQLLAGGIILAAGMFDLMLLFLPQLKQVAILERYIVTIEKLLSGQDITTGRTTLYLIAIQAFRDHPLLGIGWDQFYSLVPPEYQTISVLPIEDVHCVYLQFLCETGIIGTVLLMTPMLYLFLTTVRLLKAAKRMDDPVILRLSSFSFLLQFFLLFLGLYDPSFQKAVFWYIYTLPLMFVNAAMVRSGWRPTGPVSRGIQWLTDRLTPLIDRLWHLLRTPWERKSQQD